MHSHFAPIIAAANVACVATYIAEAAEALIENCMHFYDYIDWFEDAW